MAWSKPGHLSLCSNNPINTLTNFIIEQLAGKRAMMITDARGLVKNQETRK